MTDTSVYDFLDHHGVKGMRWGRRKGRGSSPKPEFSERSRKQKAAIIGVGTLAGYAGLKFSMAKALNLPLTVAVSAGSSSAGIALTEKLLDRHGDRKISKNS